MVGIGIAPGLDEEDDRRSSSTDGLNEDKAAVYSSTHRLEAEWEA